MISGKCAAAMLLLTMPLLGGIAAHGGPGCPFIDPVAPLAAKDSAQDSSAYVSLAWVARDFSVTIGSADSTEACIFDLDKYIAGNKTARTGLFSFKPGNYRVSFLRRHEPGSHASMEWIDTVIDLKAGTWYIARFKETSIEHKGKSASRLIRAKAWRLELASGAKEIVIKHASGERPVVKKIVLVGVVLMTLLFGGIMLYAR